FVRAPAPRAEPVRPVPPRGEPRLGPVRPRRRAGAEVAAPAGLRQRGGAMAVDLREKLYSLIRTQLDRKLRYRCLVIQAADIAVLDCVCQHAREGACFLGEHPQLLEYLDLMDDVGALSCSKVLERIDAVCASSPLVLAGPLHYLTYWSGQMQGAF